MPARCTLAQLPASITTIFGTLRKRPSAPRGALPTLLSWLAVLARTGAEPETTALTTEGLLDLASDIPEGETLVGRYFTRISYLHGPCFYNKTCGPHTERRIRETAECIDDAERLAAT